MGCKKKKGNDLPVAWRGREAKDRALPCKPVNTRRARCKENEKGGGGERVHTPTKESVNGGQ